MDALETERRVIRPLVIRSGPPGITAIYGRCGIPPSEAGTRIGRIGCISAGGAGGAGGAEGSWDRTVVVWISTASDERPMPCHICPID